MNLLPSTNLTAFLVVLTLSITGCHPLQHKTTDRVGDDIALFASDSAELFEQQCERAVSNLTANLEKIESATNSDNASAYLMQLDRLFIELDNAYGVSQLYSEVHPDAELRSAASDCQQTLTRILTDISLSQVIYSGLDSIDSSTDDAKTRRYHQRLVKDFKRAGVDKDATVRERLKALNTEASELGQQFSKNIREDVRTITIKNPEDLDGLPKDYIDNLDKTDEGWIISTDYPSVFPFLRYANADAKRLAIYRQFLDRGYPANKAILDNMIAKRHEIAQLLGYENYAAYVTEDVMIKTQANAQRFIDQITELARPRAQQDYRQLLEQLQQQDPGATQVGNWQKFYLEEQVKKQTFQYDAKQVRQYFAYAQVKQGIFQLVKQLFDVDIVPWQTDVWHPSVTAHELRASTGKTLGYFYLDMHPRDGKYKHAAHFGLRTGVADIQQPVSALICNFPGGDNRLDEQGQLVNRGLMEHNQVETFLHEFGHLMHSLIGGHQPWSGLSGIATERDFVEAPSQLLEEWVWNYDTLKTFAVDAGGAVIPKELVNKMRDARNFGKGTHIRNQMFYAALSLAYYSTPPADLDLTKTLITLQKEYSPFDYIDDTHFYANFGHLYGYSARYYTYMWSLVIAADMFSEFEKTGLLDKTTAARYRDQILAPGGSQDAADLVANFLGRPFNYDAFIRQLNAE